MVASDTIVGLVGAGILVVALVGVFVYESGAAGTEFEAHAFDPAVTSKGTATLTPAMGTPIQPPVGAAVCNETANCRLPRTVVNFEATGLPLLSGLNYVAFLTQASHEKPIVLGALSYSQGRYSITYDQGQDQQQSSIKNFVVSLEKTQNPSAPTLIVYERGDLAANQANDLSQGRKVGLSTGTHSVRLDDSPGNVQAEMTFDGLANRTGLEYRAWLKRGDMTYDHLANYTGSTLTGPILSGALVGGASGSVEDFDEFLLTLENPVSRVDKPGGFPVFTVALSS